MKTQLFNKTQSFDKQVDKFSGKLTQESKESGRSVAKNNPPKAGATIKFIPFVVYIFSTCGQFFNKLISFIENTLQLELTRFEQLLKEYIDGGVLETLKTRKRELLTAMKTAIAEAIAFVKKQVDDAKEEIARLSKLIETDRILLEETPYIQVFWRVLFSFILMLVILGAEAFTNQKSFLFLKGENYITSLIIAIGISFVTFLLGFAVARVIQHKELEQIKKYISVAFITLVALGVYLGMAILRTKMMNSMADDTVRGSFVISKTTLILINFGFFVSLVIVKLFLFPKPEVFENNQKHKAIKNRIYSNTAKVEKLQKEVKNAHQVEKKEKDRITKDFSGQIAVVDTEIKEKYKALKTHQVAYNRALSTGYNLYDEISELALKCAGIFIQELNTFRSDGVVLELDPALMSNIPNPLSEYSYINEGKVARLFDTESLDTTETFENIDLFNNPKTNTNENTTENNENDDFEINF